MVDFMVMLRTISRVLQSGRSTIVVGPNKEAFKVPCELLTHYSPAFDKRCRVSFTERGQQIVELPGDDPSVFEDFVTWLHRPTPSVPLDRDADSLIELDVFARVRHLKNQNSDFVRTTATKDVRNPCPKSLRTVSGGTAASSILRRLCSLILPVSSSQGGSRGDSDIWEQLFIDFVDLG